MLQLRAFGTLELCTSSDADAGILRAQPRSAALLVYLLLSRPRGFQSRDTLCALFWPEADEDHARGALSQALTRIRRWAGADVLQLHGKGEVRIVPGGLECDVVAFEAAVAAGDQAAVLDLYAGPFLSGFHVHSTPAFEQWAASERDRLSALAAASARTLTHQHIARGEAVAAANMAHRALTLAPESETVAAELVRAIAASGDRATALRVYNAWAAKLRNELELEPGVEVQAVARELRASTSHAPGQASRAPTRTTVAIVRGIPKPDTDKVVHAAGPTDAGKPPPPFVRDAAGYRFTGADVAEAEELAALIALVNHNARQQRDTRRGRDQAQQAAEESRRQEQDLEHVMEVRARLVRGFGHDLKSRANIEATLALIEDLVVCASRKMEKLDTRPSPTDIQQVVREMAEEYRAQVEAAGLDLQVDLPVDIPVIWSDRIRIRLILGNLLSNAVMYPVQGAVGMRAEGHQNGASPEGAKPLRSGCQIRELASR